MKGKRSLPNREAQVTLKSVAEHLGLSRAMGALIAGLSISAYPYGADVISKITGVRDFFVTLFFVALGLKMPAPGRDTLWLAGVAVLVVIASRFAAIFPLGALLRLDVRTATVVSINLSQVDIEALLFDACKDAGVTFAWRQEVASVTTAPASSSEAMTAAPRPRPPPA